MLHLTNIEPENTWMTLEWSDGSSQQVFAMWLRDNAPMASVRDPQNGQRLIDVSDVPEGTAFSSATVSDDGGLTVTFAPDALEVTYSAEWLHQLREHNRTAPAKTLWNSAHTVASHTYDSVASDQAELAAWLRAIATDGIALLKDVPTEDEHVFKVAELFGFVRETNYGKLFDVRSVANPNNLAFTSQGLMVHTDNPYRQPVPGLQLLHCLRNDAEGGASVFVDGFHAAEELRKRAPASFDILTKVWVPFRFRDDIADLQARSPLITVDDSGEIIAVRYNNRSVAAVPPANNIEDFYRAYRQFSAILQETDAEINLRMEPGDCVVFDNERVLHGRKSFQQATRWLQGCYADKDALLSRLRVVGG